MVRKAQADIFGLLVAGFFLALVLVLIYASFGTIPEETPLIGTPIAGAKNIMQLMDYGYLFYILALSMASLYLNYKQSTSRMTIGINVLMLGLVVALSGTFVEVFVDATSTAEFTEVRQDLPIMFFIQENWGSFMFVFGCMNLYALFAKPEKEEGAYIIDGYNRI